MQKLKIVLHSKYFIYIYSILLILALTRLFVPTESKYKLTDSKFTGKIINYKIDGSKLNITIKGKEKLICIYYFKTKEELNKFSLYQPGDIIELSGNLELPKENTTENVFNYKKYLNTNNIFCILNINSYKLVKKTNSLLQIIKNKLTNYLTKEPYIEALILGDKKDLKDNINCIYQELGISHLFSISGMHISLIASIINHLLYKTNLKITKKKYIIIITILLYLLLIEPKPSVLRAIMFLILASINKLYNLNLSTLKLFFLTILIVLLYNPSFIFDIAFLYTFSISLGLILNSKENKSYFKNLLDSSIVSFLISLPITLSTFYQVNILTIIYNLFYVPFVSLIIFPLSVLSVFLPVVIPLLNITTSILETTAITLNKISIAKIIFPKIPLIFYFIEFILIFKVLIRKRKFEIFILITLFIFHYNYTKIFNMDYIKFIDVGQGDSILIHSKNDSILLDTGGKNDYYETWQIPNKKYSIAKSITLPYLKSLGIRNLKGLILTHGDYDHLGEAATILENLKVNQIILNSNKKNYLEKKLSNKNKNIIKAKQGLYLKCGNIELLQLNKSFQDENDSSQVYLLESNDIKVLLMGDATIKTEQYLLNNYDLPNIDILKVGHHGSKTSSSKIFLNTIKPDVSIISVAKRNRFNHPSRETINNLDLVHSKYYKTSDFGTVSLNFKTKKLEYKKNFKKNA